MNLKPTALQVFVTQLALELRVDVCSLYRLADNGKTLVLEASFGLEDSVIGYRLPITKGLTGRVARHAKVVAVKDPEKHPDYHHISGSGEERYRTFLGIPVLNGHQVAAVLVVQTKHSHMYLLEEISRIHETGRKIESFLQAA